jgi:signal transduction histidine kinase
VTLRVRLTLAYVVLLAPVLIVFSIVVYAIASRRIYNAVDDGLNARISGIRSLLTSEDLSSALPALESANASGFSYTIVDVAGNALYSSPTSRLEIPSLSAYRVKNARYVTNHAAGRENRYSFEPYTNADGLVVGYIGASVSLQPTDDAIDELRGVFIVGGLLVMLVTGAPAYVLAGRALRPVRQLSQLAQDIEETGDFSKRLPDQRIRGETAELIKTFNAMIARVEAMLLTQRQFFADSSHELRRPLTVLRTNIDVVQDPDLPDSEREACFDEMRIEAAAMSQLLSDLLLLSREGTQARRQDDVDLPDLAARVVDRQRQIDRDHLYGLQQAIGQRLTVVGDRERLERLVQNLLENAAENAPAGTPIRLDLSASAGMATLLVNDEGCGIPDDERPFVFERFFRGRRAREMRAEGAGLGLAIVKQIAESHGGRVEVHEASPGTTFAVHLPASVAPIPVDGAVSS